MLENDDCSPTLWHLQPLPPPLLVPPFSTRHRIPTTSKPLLGMVPPPFHCTEVLLPCSEHGWGEVNGCQRVARKSVNDRGGCPPTDYKVNGKGLILRGNRLTNEPLRFLITTNRNQVGGGLKRGEVEISGKFLLHGFTPLICDYLFRRSHFDLFSPPVFSSSFFTYFIFIMCYDCRFAKLSQRTLPRRLSIHKRLLWLIIEPVNAINRLVFKFAKMAYTR